MKTRQFLLATVALLFSVNAFAQQVLTVNFDKIKAEINDSIGKFFYPNLVARINALDTTMTSDDYYHLYYGNAFYATYSPYATGENEKTFFELIDREKFKEAITYGENELLTNPVNLKVLYWMLVCHHVMEEIPTARKYAHMYYGLLYALFSSGDGKSMETAYVVLKVPDEYMALSDLELEATGQSLIDMTDKLKIKTKGQQPQKGEKKIKAVYFNVEMPFTKLRTLMSTEDK